MATTKASPPPGPRKNAGGGGNDKKIAGMPASYWAIGAGALVIGYVYLSHKPRKGQGSGGQGSGGRGGWGSPPGMSSIQITNIFKDWQDHDRRRRGHEDWRMHDEKTESHRPGS